MFHSFLVCFSRWFIVPIFLGPVLLVLSIKASLRAKQQLFCITGKFQVRTGWLCCSFSPLPQVNFLSANLLRCSYGGGIARIKGSSGTVKSR